MKRLLLVDDDALIVRSYRDRLSAHGFQVNTAANTAAAMRILRSAKPDLVVLDLMMPEVSGVEVLKFIRGQPTLAATPVVVLTNAFLNDLGREAAAIGIEKALLKSQCSPSVLMAAIDEILQAKVAPADSPVSEAAPQASHGDMPDEAEPGASADLMASAHEICTDLRRLLQALPRPPHDGPESAQRLQDLYRVVHSLAAAAGLTRYKQIAYLASVFEALLYMLVEKPEPLNPSVRRTLASLVDFVELLFQQARESGTGAAWSSRVLAVDDDALSNRLVASALQQAEIQVRTTEDPLVALNWLQQEHFDLVLLDIQMPGLDGFELCKRLRALPGYKLTPVIYVTGHDDFGNRAKSTLSGGNDLIAKPFLALELTAKVVMHLLKSQLTA